MGRKVTAADVAREAGVSAATVDRVLNNRGGVSEHKERSVFAAARRLKLDRALDPRTSRTLRVAAFIQPPSNPFHASLKAAIVASNTGPNPFNVQIRIFHADPANPKSTVAKLRAVAAGYDALITCVPHDPELAEFLDRTAQAGKPVVTLATDIHATQAIYVGPDNYRSGRLAGDLVGRFMGPSGGDVLVVAGLLSMIGQSERRAGFEDALGEYHPNCRVVEVMESRDDGERAGDLVYSALKRNPTIRGIYNASLGAVPVARALDRLGRSSGVVFVTHELTEKRRDLLCRGVVDAVIDQNPDLEMDIAIKAIASACGRLEAPLSDTMTPVRVYLRDNC